MNCIFIERPIKGAYNGSYGHSYTAMKTAKFRCMSASFIFRFMGPDFRQMEMISNNFSKVSEPYYESSNNKRFINPNKVLASGRWHNWLQSFKASKPSNLSEFYLFWLAEPRLWLLQNCIVFLAPELQLSHDTSVVKNSAKPLSLALQLPQKMFSFSFLVSNSHFHNSEEREKK